LGDTTANPHWGLIEFDELLVGGDFNRRRRRHGNVERQWNGDLEDIRIWDHPVMWPEATAGSPPQAEPQLSPDDLGATLEIPCISSQLNTWDLACAEEISDDLKQDFGIVGETSQQVTIEAQAFRELEEQSQVVTCGPAMGVKSNVYAGKFGDGLTGEYFQLRQNCQPPFLFGEVPSLVRVDPNISFAGEFEAPFREYAIRWTGKVLIETTGIYEFTLGAEDGAWLAVDEQLLVNNGNCKHHNTRYEEKSASKHLEKGGHYISVVYFNRGPSDNGATGEVGDPGDCRLFYNGPDSGNVKIIVPQDKLGSNPLRMSQLNQDEPEVDPLTTNVQPGTFVWDSNTLLAIMPVGSCTYQCRAGSLREAGAPFRFFCPASTQVSFVATVDQNAKQAMTWMDDSPAMTYWDLSTNTTDFPALLQVANRFRRRPTEPTKIALMSLGLGDMDSRRSEMAPMMMKTSSVSPTFVVGPGMHTFMFQGRPEETEAFALENLRFVEGAEMCTFFLEGEDKTHSDCGNR
jgi:hypothetical protein